MEKTYNIKKANNNADIVKNCKIVVIAVKPQIIDIVLNEIKSIEFDKRIIFISIAAGVTISKLENLIGKDKKIVRVMPNAAAFVLESMSVLSFNGNISEEDKEFAFSIFNSIGETVESEENYLDAVTALSGSGPGFIALILEAFSDAGVNVGLPRDISDKLTLQTFKGSLKLVSETDKSFIDIKNMVTSPGGTTIRGIFELEKASVKAAIMKCVDAAFKRSRELS